MKNYFTTVIKRSFAHRVITVAMFFLGFSNLGFSQLTCVQTATATGSDVAGTTVTINGISCQGAGVVSQVTMDAVIGPSCSVGWWYDYNIVVNGVTIATNQCDQTGFDLTSYLPITSVSIVAVDQNFIPNTLNMSLQLNVTYNSTPCSGSPVAGNAVSNEFVACVGDTFELTLNNQTTGVGFGYQWYQSTDSINWVSISGATALQYETTLTEDTYYRCEMSCSGNSSMSTPVKVLKGFCTPYSTEVCSQLSGTNAVEVLDIQGWNGIPVSDVELQFNFHGDLSFTGLDLNVTDVNGTFLGQLNGASIPCADSYEEIVISASTFSNMLALGNGVPQVIVTATQGVGAWCAYNGTQISFCASVSAKAKNFLYANDASINQMVSPSLGSCMLDSTVSVVVFNAGSDPLTSLNIGWEVNGVSQPIYNWTGAIASGVLDTVVIGTYTGGFSDYDELLMYVYAPNGGVDSNNVMDSLNQTVRSAFSGDIIVDFNGSGEFTSLSMAVQALENFGVCGPVNIRMKDGVYFESFTLSTDNIAGYSGTNNLTIESFNLDPLGVTINNSANSSASNHIIAFEDAHNVSINAITFSPLDSDYSRSLYTQEFSSNSNISVNNSRFIGFPAPSSTINMVHIYFPGNSNSNFSFHDNYFLGGSVGIRVEGDFNSPVTNVQVSNNYVEDVFSTGIHLSYLNTVLVTENHIASQTNASSLNAGYSTYGILATYLADSVTISKNYIGGSYSFPRHGIYLTSVSGTASNPIVVENNRIYSPGPLNYYGVSLGGCDYVNFTHNSIFKIGNQGINAAFHAGGGSNVFLANNIFSAVTGTCLAISSSANSPIVASDNNNFSFTFGTMAKLDTVSVSDLSSWVAQTQYDSNSLNVLQPFSDTAQLLVCSSALYQKGMSLGGATHDFEGDPRAAIPCIGADEFMPISELANLPSNVLCSNDTLFLEQYYFDTVVWNMVDTTNIYMVTSPGTQNLYVSGQCGTANVNIQVQPPSPVQLPNSNLCQNGTLQMETGIAGATSYLWNDGSTDSILIVSSPGIIWVEVTDSSGCISSDTAVISQSMAVDLPDSANFCEGANVVLDAGVSGLYLWNDGSIGQTLNVTSPGVYGVTVTDQNCMSSDSVYVYEILDVIPEFTQTIVGTTVTFVNNSQNGTTYMWDFGDGNTSVDENPVHTYITSDSCWAYDVTLTVENDCGSLDYQSNVTNCISGVSAINGENNILVYPNPNVGVFTLEVTNLSSGPLSLQVRDIAGKIVFLENSYWNGGDYTRNLQLDKIPVGIYFIILFSDQSVFVKQFVIH